MEFERELEQVSEWSKDSNLLLNPSKTKLVLFSTTQMATTHHLDALNLVEIKINGEFIERKKSWKVRAIEFTMEYSFERINKIKRINKILRWPAFVI